MLPSYERPVLKALQHRLEEKSPRLINISGPRQCGKTTLIQQALEKSRRPFRYLSADLPAPTAFPQWGHYDAAPFNLSVPHGHSPDARWLVHNWEQARIAARQYDKGFILVLDEVHHIQDWSRIVKGLWDEDRRVGRSLHVVLLGSAPLVYRTSMHEGLTGRFETIRLAHWSFEEMEAAFGVSLEKYIYFGGYPGAAHWTQDEARWLDYVMDALIRPTLDRDVLALSRIDKPALLRQLLELGSSYSGQIVSYNRLLGQLQDAGNATTLAHYLELLSQAGLMRGLDKYAFPRLRRKLSSPKLLVLNTALMSALGDYSFDEARSDRSYWGRLVESAVGAHLCNTATNRINVHYWRQNGEEVDYVLQRGRLLLGIEVKTTARRRPARGLETFKRRYDSAKTLTVGTHGLPLKELLRTSSAALLRNA